MEIDLILEEIAKDYLSGVDSESLKDIANSSDINSEELKEWLESDYPEKEFNDNNISDLIDYIVVQAKWKIEKAKQEDASELRSSIEFVLNSQYSLENYEIASILADYVVQYLNTGL